MQHLRWGRLAGLGVAALLSTAAPAQANDRQQAGAVKNPSSDELGSAGTSGAASSATTTGTGSSADAATTPGSASASDASSGPSSAASSGTGAGSMDAGASDTPPHPTAENPPNHPGAKGAGATVSGTPQQSPANVDTAPSGTGSAADDAASAGTSGTSGTSP